MRNPYNRFHIQGDNLVAKCDWCGKAAHLCNCDDEDWEDDGETHPDNDIDEESVAAASYAQKEQQGILAATIILCGL